VVLVYLKREVSDSQERGKRPALKQSVLNMASVIRAIGFGGIKLGESNPKVQLFRKETPDSR
jgi:hypothetical protein